VRTEKAKAHACRSLVDNANKDLQYTKHKVPSWELGVESRACCCCELRVAACELLRELSCASWSWSDLQHLLPAAAAAACCARARGYGLRAAAAAAADYRTTTDCRLPRSGEGVRGARWRWRWRWRCVEVEVEVDWLELVEVGSGQSASG
jgi:hypothetical protein